MTDAFSPDRSKLHGRRRGKKLRSFHSALMADLLPQLLFARSASGEIAQKKQSDSRELWIEIGFGGGEHIAHQAAMHPEVDFIGCEPFENGVAKLLAEISQKNLTNIQIHVGDASEVMRELPDASVSRIYLLFPDPWPKRRHRKRRFISPESLAEIARILRVGAELRFATDIDDYSGWTLSRVIASGKFEWTARNAQDWQRPWADHLVTRFEKRAAKQRTASIYTTFLRSRAPEIDDAPTD